MKSLERSRESYQSLFSNKKDGDENYDEEENENTS